MGVLEVLGAFTGAWVKRGVDGNGKKERRCTGKKVEEEEGVQDEGTY